MADITFMDGSYVVKFGYDRQLLDNLKTMIPYAGRKWNQEDKTWRIDPRHTDLLRVLFPNDTIPEIGNTVMKPQRYSVDLHYVGQVKDRGNNEFTAFGWARDSWSVVLPESVLKEWFEGTPEKPKLDTSSYYGILGVTNFAPLDEIKAGYRRMAKQWHPDVCREPNAAEVFQKIRDGYESLNDPDRRVRYDVGLQFELKSENHHSKKKSMMTGDDLYRAPLRCGKLEVEATVSLGRLIVSKIFTWEDIIDSHGRTLTTSWIMGADKPFEVWS